MGEALQRAVSMLQDRIELRKLSKEHQNWSVPRWLYITDFTSALHHMTVVSAKSVIPILRNIEETVREQIAKMVPKQYQWKRAQERLKDGKVPGLSDLCAVNYNSQKRMVCAVTRMQFGAALEAILSFEALILCGVNQKTRDSTFGRLCSDACKVATFTSAHTEYVNDVQNGLEEPCVPSLWTVASSASELDLSDLLQRQGRIKGLKKVPATIVKLLHKLQTVTLKNFESVLAQSVRECPCLKMLFTNLFVVSASGLHEHLHPAVRPPWSERFVYTRIIKHTMANCTGDFSLRCCTMAREVLRRNVVESYSSSLATKRAMARLHLSMGTVAVPPLKPPEPGLERCQRILLSALQSVVDELVAPLDLIQEDKTFNLDEFFIHRLNCLANSQTFVSDWMPRPPFGSSLKSPFVNTAGEMWLAAHRAVAAPIYVNAYAHGHRISRFDSSLHQAALDMNTLSKLVNTLTEDQQLWVQQIALRDPKSGVLSFEEVAYQLGIQTRTSRRMKNLHDILNAIPNGEAAAMMFAYARVAWIKEELLSIDLGPISARSQTIGVLRRLSHPMLQEALDTTVDKFDVAHFTSKMPVHAHTLFLCAECRRICNATHVDGLRSGISFNELGLASCMVCRETETDWHLRCARRASAALRAAQVAEHDTITKRLTDLEPNEQFRALLQLDERFSQPPLEDELELESKLDSPPLGGLGEVTDALKGEESNLDPSKSSTEAKKGKDRRKNNILSSRFRRDLKTLLEQRSSAASCGEERLVEIPLIGRIVRVYGSWIGVCAVCGAFHRVLSENRFGSEICCGRCDPTLLGLARPATKQTASLPCRFCGRYQRAGALPRWRQLRAPHDLSGDNASRPPPLRVVSYCQAHLRIWMPSAHRTLSTPVILSHLAHGVRSVGSLLKPYRTLNLCKSRNPKFTRGGSSRVLTRFDSKCLLCRAGQTCSGGCTRRQEGDARSFRFTGS